MANTPADKRQRDDGDAAPSSTRPPPQPSPAAADGHLLRAAHYVSLSRWYANTDGYAALHGPFASRAAAAAAVRDAYSDNKSDTRFPSRDDAGFSSPQTKTRRMVGTYRLQRGAADGDPAQLHFVGAEDGRRQRVKLGVFASDDDSSAWTDTTRWSDGDDDDDEGSAAFGGDSSDTSSHLSQASSARRAAASDAASTLQAVHYNAVAEWWGNTDYCASMVGPYASEPDLAAAVQRIEGSMEADATFPDVDSAGFSMPRATAWRVVVDVCVADASAPGAMPELCVVGAARRDEVTLQRRRASQGDDGDEAA